jgi:hypothetical protein
MNENNPGIKRVIRHTRTGQFFREGQWTPKFEEATLFTVREALAACKKYDLKDTELVLHFGETQFDIATPICT